jgi:peptidoglycan/LPS O-acetylase OafA/YrhL
VTEVNHKGRVFGLDILRALAVLTVLVGHSAAHLEPPEWFRWYWSAQGTLGVEIFFVLSGFLIGTILIRLSRQGRLHTPAMVWNFWSRRWARTLPLYFFFVLVYLRFDYLGVGDLRRVYPFLFFMQNFAWPQLPFFQHSWSLSIEEWFYFLFPMVFLWFARDERAYRVPMLATCIVFIVLPLLVRMAVAQHLTGFDAFNNQIRMVVVTRLDAIFFGVLMALLKAELPSLYRSLRWCGVPASILLVAVSFYLAAGAPGLTAHYWAMVLGFPLLSLFIMFTLPMMEEVKTLGFAWLDRLISYTSKVSYSLYLGHICMLTLVNALLAQWGMQIHGPWRTGAVYLVYAAAFYSFATLTWLFVERPFLQLRDAPASRNDGGGDGRSISRSYTTETAVPTVGNGMSG